MLNVRIGYITYPHEELRASGLRHYPADHHLLSWLEAKGYEFDVLTDWELHHDGHRALKDYAVVLTERTPSTTHAKCSTRWKPIATAVGASAISAATASIGRSHSRKSSPDCWRYAGAEGGIRAWAAEAGEYYNQLDGEYGGLWRRNGRPRPGAGGRRASRRKGPSRARTIASNRRARQSPRVAWMLAAHR